LLEVRGVGGDDELLEAVEVIEEGLAVGGGVVAFPGPVLGVDAALGVVEEVVDEDVLVF
jgi:hypothetical protein